MQISEELVRRGEFYEFMKKSDERFEKLLQELRAFREDTNRRFEAVDRRFDKVDSDFKDKGLGGYSGKRTSKIENFNDTAELPISRETFSYVGLRPTTPQAL